MRALLVLVGAVLTLVVGAGPATAHNVLTGTIPAGGAEVATTPDSVVLTFDQPVVAMGTQVLVTGPSGQVQTGTTRLVDDTVTQDVVAGAPAGVHTVAWRVTSADGHPVSGTFTFTSTRAGVGTPPTRTPAAYPSEATPVPPGPTGVGLVALAVLAVLAVTAAVVAARRRRQRPEPPAGRDSSDGARPG